jgi:putative SOS response-associated peptidase YedK
MAFADLLERLNDPKPGGTPRTFTIFTGPPDELCGPIHNRMAVIMPLEAWRLWLGEEQARIDELLGSCVLTRPN